MTPLFGDLFDLNGDGVVSPAEELTGLAFLEQMEKEDALKAAGLRIADLEVMDEDERRDALEAAGLDPNDYN